MSVLWGWFIVCVVIVVVVVVVVVVVIVVVVVNIYESYYKHLLLFWSGFIFASWIGPAIKTTAVHLS